MFSAVQTDRARYHLSYDWGGGDKRVHVFPKGSCPHLNVIAVLGFELAFFEVVVQEVNYYAYRDSPTVTKEKRKNTIYEVEREKTVFHRIE